MYLRGPHLENGQVRNPHLPFALHSIISFLIFNYKQVPRPKSPLNSRPRLTPSLRPSKSKLHSPLSNQTIQNPPNQLSILFAKAQNPYSVQAHVKTPEVRNSIVYETNYSLTFRTYKNPGNNTATHIWRTCYGAYRAHPSPLRNVI